MSSKIEKNMLTNNIMISNTLKQKLRKFYGFKRMTPKMATSSGFDSTNDYWNYLNSQRNDFINDERQIKKEKQRVERLTKYSVNIKFLGEVTRYNSKTKKTEKTNIPVNKTITVKGRKSVSKKALKKLLDDQMTEWQNVDMSYRTGAKRDPDVQPMFTKINKPSKNYLTNQKMKEISLEYNKISWSTSGFKLSEIDQKKGECVVDYLIHKYNNPDETNRRRCIKKFTREKIIDILTDCYPDGFDISDGINCNDITILMRYLKSPAIGCNIDESTFYKYHPRDDGLPVNKSIPYTLIFMMANGHFYPIEDAKIRASIISKAYPKKHHKTDLLEDKYKSVSEDKKIESKIIRLPDVMDSISKIPTMTNTKLYYNTEDLTEVLIELAHSTHTIYNDDLRFNKTGLKSIHIKNANLKIYSNTEYDDVNDCCKKLYNVMVNKDAEKDILDKYVFENQSLVGLSLQYFDDNFNLPKSQFNCNVDKLFKSDFTKTIAFNETFSNPTNLNNTKAYDINGCYTSALDNNIYEFCIFSPFDEVEVYDNKGFDRPGYYFVSTTNFFPFTGSGFYHYGFLIECQKLNIKFQVTHQLLPSTTLEADHFKKFISDITNNSNQSKLMINGFIGCLNKTTRTAIESYYTTNADQAGDFFYNNKDITVSTVFDSECVCDEERPKHYNKTIYQLQKKVDTKFEETSQPIYNQILQLSHIQLYILWKKTKGKLVQLKTDCVIVEGGEDVECNTIRGGYKQEEIPEEFFITKHKTRTDRYKLKINTWNKINKIEDIIDRNKGCFIDGMAGTGKTYILNKVIDKLEKKGIQYMRLSPTNKGALLIGGQTLHKGLGVEEGKLYSTKKLGKIGFNKYIIIDEYGMMTAQFWKILKIIKIKFPDTKFIISGDARQLPPIEEVARDYTNMLLLKELTNFNYLPLTKNMRSDNVMWDLYHKTLDGVDVQDEFKSTKMLKKNITYYNKSKDKLNQYWMDKESKENKNVLEFGDEYKFKLVDGSPIIVIENNKKLDIINNEQFELMGWDDNYILIKNDRLELSINYKDFERYIRPAYAITCHCAQGDTLTGEYGIWDWGRLPEDIRNCWRYTAISRTTTKSNIYICDSKQLDNQQYQITKKRTF